MSQQDSPGAQPTANVNVNPPEMIDQKLQSFEHCVTVISQAFINYLRHKDEEDPQQQNRPATYEPTIVQQYVYPFLKGRQNVMVRAPTGTGKTIAFLLPIMEQLIKQGPSRTGNPRCIVVLDTKDLCEQHWVTARKISQELDVFGYRLTVECYIGTMDRGSTAKFASNNLINQRVQCDIAIMSPGKLNDFLGGFVMRDGNLSKKRLDLSDLQYLVVDEADEVFFPGKFLKEMDLLAKELQLCREKIGSTYCLSLSFFSATLFPNDQQLQRAIQKLTGGVVMEDFGYVAVEYDRFNIIQRVLRLESFDQKVKALVQLLDKDLEANGTTRENCRAHGKYDYSTIIFCDTRKTAYCLTTLLLKYGFKVKFHTGDLPQHLRARNCRLLDLGKLPFLITTNALARGIDKACIKHVIMFDLPVSNWDSYTHRVGRTGRSGTMGLATIFFDVTRVDDRKRGHCLLRSLYLTKQVIPRFLFNSYASQVFPDEFLNRQNDPAIEPRVDYAFEAADDHHFYNDNSDTSSLISLDRLAPEEPLQNLHSDDLSDDVTSDVTAVLPDEEMLVGEPIGIQYWSGISHQMEARSSLAVSMARSFTNDATSGVRNLLSELRGPRNVVAADRNRTVCNSHGLVGWDSSIESHTGTMYSDDVDACSERSDFFNGLDATNFQNFTRGNSNNRRL